MWVTKLLISPVKKKDFLPKNDQIWPKIGIFGQFWPGHAGLFGALLLRAVSRKTPIYFIIIVFVAAIVHFSFWLVFMIVNLVIFFSRRGDKFLIKVDDSKPRV